METISEHQNSRTLSVLPNTPRMSVPHSPAQTPADSGEKAERSQETGASPDRQKFIDAYEPRNLLALALHNITLRIAWIFKTESVIMPAFMDAIAGAGWLRGCLPLLNRVGQSVPSLAFSDSVRRTSQKKWSLLTFSMLMAVPFLTLSAVWFVLDDKRAVWLPAAFLVLYFLFFTANGLNQLVFGTLQGKLIRPHRRGRLMGLAGTFGAIPAIFCAWFLLQKWVALPDGGFGYIFAFTGFGFLAAAMVTTVIVEPADQQGRVKQRRARHLFRDAWQTLQSDHDFRNFCLVAMLFMSAQMLFPHYQALGRAQTGYENVQLMIWVVAQNAGAGVFSPLAGMIADRFGNRRAMRWEIAATVLTPLLAIVLTANGTAIGWYWTTFFLLGLVPVTMKTMSNYALEICTPDKHPQYLSTMRVCMALPFFLSPFFGFLVDAAGFAAVFCVISALVFTGGLLTWRIPEPRYV